MFAKDTISPVSYKMRFICCLITNKLGNNVVMTKNEYIEKLKNLILQRVNFHAPKQENIDIDYSILQVVGIDASYPIFVFKKPMNVIFLKAFLLAKKEAKFNLVITEKPLFKEKILTKLDLTYLLMKEEHGSALANALEGLNINYVTKSGFEKDIAGEYVKVQGQTLDFDFLPYYKMKKARFEGVNIEVKKFLLNGKNTTIALLNTTNQRREVSIEVNLPLPRGYYAFKKDRNSIEIKNLTTADRAYFNFNLPCPNFSFSMMNGIESCTYAGINLRCKISLLPKQSKKMYYNFGDNKYCFSSPKEVDDFFKLSQQRADEIFDIKVQTRDKEFDNLFNLSLPRKIWEKWEKFDIDEESENSWLKIKQQIIKNYDKGEQISRDFKGLKEVRLYRNLGWKRVFVLHGESNYLFADRVKYFNFNLLTKEIFAKNNEIYLSFAE